jgi:hypothetical protein
MKAGPARIVILSVAKNLALQKLKILHFVQDDITSDFFSKLLEFDDPGADLDRSLGTLTG